tara:strand:+ start:7175 stop:7345 length:171 start_codon:yes stop_codon:yes gene_type:complete
VIIYRGINYPHRPKVFVPKSKTFDQKEIAEIISGTESKKAIEDRSRKLKNLRAKSI